MSLTERSSFSAALLLLIAGLALTPRTLLAEAASGGSATVPPHFEEGLMPMYVIGDLNEDGVVDQKDRALLAAIVASPSATPPAAVTCLAAGDLNFDGKVDSKDLAMLNEWLKHGPRLTAPALGYETRLPCDFTHPIMVARCDAHPGERVPIRFRDRSLNSSNSTVTVRSGPATVQVAKEGGYDVITSRNAKPGDTVTVLLSLPNGRRYLYTYPIVPIR